MSDYKVIGQRAPKADALERVTGSARFGADIHLSGMLHARVLRCPHPHARIRRIDVARALAREGVKAVVTAADMPPLDPSVQPVQGEVAVELKDLKHLVLAHEKAFFAGQPVAAVAAVSPFIAEEALGLVDVEYQVLPVVEDVLEAMKPDAPLLHDDLYTKTLGETPARPSNIALHHEWGRGDVEEGFRQASVVVERTYRTAMVHQGYIEPQSCTAQWDPDGSVTVWSSTQGSFNLKMQLCALLGIPLPKLRVVPMEIGGGFGGKIYTLVEPLCVLLAKKAGRPVKLTLSREEVLRATGPAPPAVVRVKAGATREGKLTAVQMWLAFDAGCFPGAPVAAAALAGLAPYRVDHLRVDGFDVVTNKPRVHAYRAPGAPQGAFAVEALMDELSERLGIDPLELRRINAVQESDLQANNVKFNRIGLKQVIEAVARHPHWTTPLTGKNRGRGLALGHWMGAALVSSCHVAVNGDGSLALTVGSVDLTGTRTALGQIAAEEFGLPYEMVKVTVGDTESAGYTDVSGGSRITYSMGTAVHRACQDALAQLKARAAAALKAPAEEIEYADTIFRVRGKPDQAVSLLDLARQSIRRGEGPVMGKGTVARLQPAPAFAAHLVDVEVDPGTGKVRVLRYTCFQDAGRAVNPTQVEGQMQGGAAQGIGWALTEGYIFEGGVLRNASMLDYRTPTALDVPMIDTVIIEVPASDGPFGVRGVGEVPIVPPLAALASAIHRAVGVRLAELPMTPERVLLALRARRPEPVAAG